MNILTLPTMPTGYVLSLESANGESYLYLTGDTLAGSVEWTCSTGEITYGAEIELPAEVTTAVEAFLTVSARYEYAARAHAPRNDGEFYPVCGAANFSRNAYGENPVTATTAEFSALPDESTCWECRSIIA